MFVSSSSQQGNYPRTLDSTDGPHNNQTSSPTLLQQHSSTQIQNRSLNYQSPLVRNNQTTAATNTNDQNNNPNNIVTNNVNGTNQDAAFPAAQVNSSNGRDLFSEIRNGGGHWSQLLRQVVLSSPSQAQPEKTGTDRTSETPLPLIPLQVQGGSENGQFAVVGQTNPDINQWIAVGYLQQGDILLEVQGQQVRPFLFSLQNLWLGISGAVQYLLRLPVTVDKVFTPHAFSSLKVQSL